LFCRVPSAFPFSDMRDNHSQGRKPCYTRLKLLFLAFYSPTPWPPMGPPTSFPSNSIPRRCAFFGYSRMPPYFLSLFPFLFRCFCVVSITSADSMARFFFHALLFQSLFCHFLVFSTRSPFSLVLPCCSVLLSSSADFEDPSFTSTHGIGLPRCLTAFLFWGHFYLPPAPVFHLLPPVVCCPSFVFTRFYFFGQWRGRFSGLLQQDFTGESFLCFFTAVIRALVALK